MKSHPEFTAVPSTPTGELEPPHWAPGLPLSHPTGPEPGGSGDRVNRMGKAAGQRFLRTDRAWFDRVPALLTPVSSVQRPHPLGLFQGHLLGKTFADYLGQVLFSISSTQTHLKLNLQFSGRTVTWGVNAEGGDDIWFFTDSLKGLATGPGAYNTSNQYKSMGPWGVLLFMWKAHGPALGEILLVALLPAWPRTGTKGQQDSTAVRPASFTFSTDSSNSPMGKC